MAELLWRPMQSVLSLTEWCESPFEDGHRDNMEFVLALTSPVNAVGETGGSAEG